MGLRVRKLTGVRSGSTRDRTATIANLVDRTARVLTGDVDPLLTLSFC
jgi:hypothetical protein